MKELLLAAALLSLVLPAQGAYVVRVRDLQYSPTPPNPIKVAGRVTSVLPLKVSDGEGEITVAGVEAAMSDFLVVTGDWDGSVLTVTGLVEYLVGPAATEMVYISAGSFLMGNNGSEPYTRPEELPQHTVDLSRFWIGKYEVTRCEYRCFMEAGGYSNPAYWSSDGWSWKVSQGRTEPGNWAEEQDWGSGLFAQTDSHPVVGVSYHEAEAYCNWAGGHLPTEAQWEKAARWTGSYPNVYPWGNVWDAEKCNNWYDTNPAGGGYKCRQTAPAGSYPAGASPSGCQDMAGNVWEWCQDWYKSYPGSSSPFDYTDGFRVLRGGCYTNYNSDCRAATRNSEFPVGYWYLYGFRVARW